jgi:hypothetical protein
LGQSKLGVERLNLFCPLGAVPKALLAPIKRISIPPWYWITHHFSLTLFVAMNIGFTVPNWEKAEQQQSETVMEKHKTTS